MTNPVLLFALLLFVLLASNSVKILREYERGVVFRLGRLIATKGPGIIWLWPFIDRMVNGVAVFVQGTGARARRLQTGVVGNYAFSLLLGAVILVGFLFWS